MSASKVSLTLENRVCEFAKEMERATGIEPVLPTWEAETKRVPVPLAQAGTDRIICRRSREIRS